MMMIKCLLLSLSFGAQAQKLEVGQLLPVKQVKNIYNYKNQEFKYTDFKAKLIVFEFWSPSCSSCLGSFEKLDALQKRYKNEIQIIMVNRESLDSTRNLFRKRKFLFKPDLPFITADTLFNQIFPNRGNPALAWIDGEGNFYGMTGDITTGSIDDFLKDKVLSNDKYLSGQVYLNDLFNPELVKYVKHYSYLSKWIPGVSVIGNQIGNLGVGLTNASIPELYIKAYDPNGKYQFDKPGRVVLEVSDRTKYFPPKDDNEKNKWFKENSFNYALLLPENSANDKYKVMQDDLSRYFSLKAQIKKQSVKCFVLIRTNEQDKLKTKGKNAAVTFFRADSQTEINTTYRVLYNKPFSIFSGMLGNWIENKYRIPFIDQTNYIGLIDIKMKGEVIDELNIPDLKKELSRYHLDLIEKYVMLDVLILSDK